MKPVNSIAESSGPSLTPNDIFYILFRHKRKIFLFTLLGLVAGAATYFLWPDTYASQAQLLVKYVTEKREVVSEDGSTRTMSPGGRGSEHIINTELAILNSADLAIEVSESPETEELRQRISQQQEEPVAITPAAIKKGLTASSGRGSNIVSLSFNHPNREVAQAILNQVIDQYLLRHFQVHQDRGTFDEFLTRQSDRAKARLMQTEQELIAARRQAGLISVEQARTNLNNEISAIRHSINTTEADIAENQSIYDQITRQFNRFRAEPGVDLKDGDTPAHEEVEIAAAVREFERKRTQLEVLRSMEKSLLMRFTPESRRYQNVLVKMEQTEEELEALQSKYPEVFNRNIVTEEEVANINPEEAAQTARLQEVKIVSLKSRLEQLRTQLANLQEEAGRIDEVELTINDLMRRKSLEESNYNTLLKSLENNRLSEANNDGRVSNITVIQSPTRAGVAQNVKAAVAGGVAGGLIALGLLWAFAVELLFDQSIKRATDIRRTLGIPLFLTLPDTNSKAFRRLSSKSSPERMRLVGKQKAHALKQKNSEYAPVSGTLRAAAKAQPDVYGNVNGSQDAAQIAPWDEQHALHDYFDALRDKVIGYFESRNLIHNPKLIGMTGLGKQPGVTTIASGLASSLSKTEGGNVLLVDMTLGRETAQQFYKGKAVGDIDEALETKGKGQLEGNLYVVAEGSNGYKLPSILPRRFNSIIPKLKASDFDYIIFDMPPVSPISSTPRLASYMDITLMVVESEETSREVAKQATELLSESNAQLGAILNKTKSYLPNQLEQDFNGLS